MSTILNGRPWSILLFLLLSVFFSPSARATTGTVNVYPVQSALYTTSSVYSLTANGQNVPVTHSQDYEVAQFSLGGGSATLKLTKANGTAVGAYSITPQKLGITATLSGATATFTVASAQYLIVHLDGQSNLIIAIDPAETSVPPTSGTGIFNITSSTYGAVSSQTAYATTAIQNALNDASTWGTAQGNNAQGIVYVPSGIWPIGNLVLKSNSALYLAPGAVLLYTGDSAYYNTPWYKSSQSRYVTWLITTDQHSTNIKMYGRGTVDGNGKQTLTVDNLGVSLLVPVLVSNFVMDGITFRVSSSWCIIPIRNYGATFSNFKVFNDLDMGENDGIDVNESTNVTVSNAITMTLDDSYSTKTWGPATSGSITSTVDGDPRVINNVTFENVIGFTYCYVAKVGQGVEQSQSNVLFDNVTVFGASASVGIDYKYGGASAKASNIKFSNFDIEHDQSSDGNIKEWLSLQVDSGSNAGSDPVDGVTISNINVRSLGQQGSQISGLSGSPINNVTLKDIVVPGSTSDQTTLAGMNITTVSNTGTITISN